MLLKPWNGSLRTGTLIQRCYRFLLDVRLDNGEVVVAHCANPGAMEGLIVPGAKVWLSASIDGEESKLKWIWELVEVGGVIVCANSWTANKLVKSLIQTKTIPGLKRFTSVTPETKLGKRNRIDFKLTTNSDSHFIEVKSLQQSHGEGIGYFPDSKTKRSSEHLEALLSAHRDGHKITMLIVVQRKDVKIVRVSDIHDIEFCNRLRSACKLGLKVRAILLEPTPEGFDYHGEVPVDLTPYNSVALTKWRASIKQFSGWARTKPDPDAKWRSAKK